MSGEESDSLGLAGEDAFRSLCSRAKLIVTKSDPDRCGWDFRLEWRRTKGRKLSDSSPPRRAALVQVKSVFKGASNFTVRLGAASDLVNTLEPSFFVVLVFDRQLNLAEVRVAPTLGPIASEILRAVRQCAADESDAVNRPKHFRVTKWAEKIADHPGAIDAYFREHIGDDLRQYSAKKQKFLKETGFEGAHVSLNARLFGTPEEVADAMLGDRSILGELVSAFEERFNIPLPLENFQPSAGAFEFSPVPFAQVRATFEDKRNGKRFKFEGTEYRLPAIIAEDFRKIKFDFQYFTLHLLQPAHGVGKISFTVRAKDLKSVRATARSWLEFYRFLDSASRRRLKISVRQIGSSGSALVGSAGGDPEISSKFQTATAVEILSLLNTVVRDCGLESAELSPDDVNNMENLLNCLVQASGKIGPPYLNLEVDSLDNPITQPRLLLLFTLGFLDRLLTIIVDAFFVEHVAGDTRDLYKLERVKYLRSDITDDYEEVETIASLLASKHADRDVLMLPQGDIGQPVA